MNSFELNKVVGAVLLGGFVLLVSSILAGKLVVPHRSETHMAMPAGESGGEAAAPAPEEKLEPVVPLLASADLAAGQEVFKKCAACHTTEKGGPNKVGPNLWGVVGGPHGHKEDFAYSDALKSKPGNWDYEALNAWLFSPKAYAPGTKMSFAGLKKAQDRANVIAWLRTQSDSPLPLPDAAAVEAAAPAQAEAAPAQPEAAAPAQPEAAPAAPSEGTAATATQTAAATAASLPDLLKAADAANGEKIAAKCKACHDFTKGGPNKVGPNLWDIVGAKQAHLDNFNYSDAVKGLGGEWTYENLDKFLTKPKDYAPGTKMTFPGLQKPEDRAAVIAYLRTLSDSAKPLP